MQPEMPTDLVVPSIRGTEAILDSLIACVILLLGRQIALSPECTGCWKGELWLEDLNAKFFEFKVQNMFFLTFSEVFFC